MKNYYYITGASRGIGKSLAERILKEKNSKVIGISRSNTVVNDNFMHLPIDLSNPSEVNKFSFEEFSDASSFTLINNAGMLGEVKPVGKQTDENIEKLFYLNVIAPVLLMNKFIAAYADKKIKRSIVNISSGAAKNPIAGWSAYCASKAALEHV